MSVVGAIRALGGVQSAVRLVRRTMKQRKRAGWSSDLEVVLRVLVQHEKLAPIRRRPTKDDGLSAAEGVGVWWVEKYLKAREASTRPRLLILSKSYMDPAVEVVIRSGVSGASKNASSRQRWYKQVKCGQNLVGHLLEEFVASELKEWQCAWGATIRGVDFCRINSAEQSELLQVKNSQVTENSSSQDSRVRKGVRLWYRFDSSNGCTRWRELLLEAKHTETALEARFHKFIKKRMSTS